MSLATEVTDAPIADRHRALAAEMFAIFVHPAPTVALIDTYQKAIARAQQAAANSEAEAAEWVSIAERLPQNGERVLVWHGGWALIATHLPGLWSQRFSVSHGEWLLDDQVMCWRSIPVANPAALRAAQIHSSPSPATPLEYSESELVKSYVDRLGTALMRVDAAESALQSSKQRIAQMTGVLEEVRDAIPSGGTMLDYPGEILELRNEHRQQQSALASKEATIAELTTERDKWLAELRLMYEAFRPQNAPKNPREAAQAITGLHDHVAELTAKLGDAICSDETRAAFNIELTEKLKAAEGERADLADWLATCVAQRFMPTEAKAAYEFCLAKMDQLRKKPADGGGKEEQGDYSCRHCGASPAEPCDKTVNHPPVATSPIPSVASDPLVVWTEDTLTRVAKESDRKRAETEPSVLHEHVPLDNSDSEQGVIPSAAERSADAKAPVGVVLCKKCLHPTHEHTDGCPPGESHWMAELRKEQAGAWVPKVGDRVQVRSTLEVGEIIDTFDGAGCLVRLETGGDSMHDSVDLFNKPKAAK